MDLKSYYSPRPPDVDVDSVLCMEQASFSWQAEGGGRFSLNDLNLNVVKGQFVGVIGRVGSGKSSLLQAITGDLVKKRGHIAVGDAHEGIQC